MRRTLFGVGVLAAAACSDGQPNPVGTAEPIRVQNAQFFTGPLPGLPPDDGTYEPGGPPRVATMDVKGGYVVAGTAGKRLPGQVTETSYSVGFGVEAQGSGWWMIGVDDVDTTVNPPRLNFNARMDFANDLAQGPLILHVVPLTRSGEAGVQFREPLCIAATGADANAACSIKVAPPAAAITLTWDRPVDLDLQVVAPDGRIVNSKHPMLHEPEDDEPADVNAPHIDRDSNANCQDGYRSESLVWPTVPPADGETELPAGLYQVYVNLFDPCGQPTVNFRVKITSTVALDDAGGAGSGSQAEPVERVLFERGGQFIALQANPAAQKGLFITEYTF
jgi:hypothetical protein